MLVLVADDDPDLVDIVSYALRKDGHRVVSAKDGHKALELARRHHPDLAILDVMMPPPDGFEVCRQLRQEGPLPIIFLTARGEESNKVWGLDIGADHYMTKPFSHKELLARVRALGRRRMHQEFRRDHGTIEAGRIRMDLDHHEVWAGNRPVELTPKEYDLLYYFLLHAGDVITHDALVDFLWAGNEPAAGPQTIRVHVKHLREKIERHPDGPECIVNVRGVGYKLRPV